MSTDSVSAQAAGLKALLQGMPSFRDQPLLLRLAALRNVSALALYRAWCRGELSKTDLVYCLRKVCASIKGAFASDTNGSDTSASPWTLAKLANSASNTAQGSFASKDGEGGRASGALGDMGVGKDWVYKNDLTKPKTTSMCTDPTAKVRIQGAMVPNQVKAPSMGSGQRIVHMTPSPSAAEATSTTGTDSTDAPGTATSFERQPGHIAHTMDIVVAMARAGELSRDETVALAHALLEGGPSVGASGSNGWGPASAINRIIEEMNKDGNVPEAVRELKHIAALLGTGSKATLTQLEAQKGERASSAAAVEGKRPVRPAPPVPDVSPPQSSSSGGGSTGPAGVEPTAEQLVDLLSALMQGGFISPADAHSLAQGLVMEPADGGNAELQDAVKRAVIAWRASGDFGALKHELQSLGALQRHHEHRTQQAAQQQAQKQLTEHLAYQQQQKQQQQKQQLEMNSQRGRVAAAQDKTQQPALSPQDLSEMLARLAAGGLIARTHAEALARAIYSSPATATVANGAVSRFNRAGNLLGLVEELGRIDCGEPGDGDSKRHMPLKPTPFKQWPADTRKRGVKGDQEEQEPTEDSSQGTTPVGLEPTTPAFILKVLSVLEEDGLLATADAATLRASITRDPSGSVACAAAHAVAVFNATGGGDAASLVAALERACDERRDGPVPSAVTATGQNNSTRHTAQPAPAVSQAPSSAAAAAAAPWSIDDIHGFLEQLATSGLVTAADAAEAQADVDGGDTAAMHSLAAAVNELAAGRGIGAVKRCVENLGRAGKLAAAEAAAEAVLSPAGVPRSGSLTQEKEAAKSTLRAAPAASSKIITAPSSAAAPFPQVTPQRDAEVHALDVISTLANMGLLPSAAAHSLADQLLGMPGGPIAGSIKQAVNKCDRDVWDVRKLVGALQILAAQTSVAMKGPGAAATAWQLTHQSEGKEQGHEGLAAGGSAAPPADRSGSAPRSVSWALEEGGGNSDMPPLVWVPVPVTIHKAASSQEQELQQQQQQSEQGPAPTARGKVEEPPHIVSTDLRFGAGVVASAADVGLLSLGDAAVLLQQIQSGAGHLLSLELQAFQETGDIGEDGGGGGGDTKVIHEDCCKRTCHHDRMPPAVALTQGLKRAAARATKSAFDEEAKVQHQSQLLAPPWALRATPTASPRQATRDSGFSRPSASQWQAYQHRVKGDTHGPQAAAVKSCSAV